ncbi:retrotransposon-related protein [Tanacetum coccineum]
MAVSTRSTMNADDPSTQDPARLTEFVTKIEFLKFGGEDVRGWWFKCEQFFKVDNIAENCKVNLVSIHLFDLALMWHRQFVRFMGEDVDWNAYRTAILKRFDVVYDDPLGELKKLKQTTHVQEYIDAFDRLLCRIDLDENQCISFFLAGLNSEIELAIRMFKPRTLAEVYGLCKLEEAKVNAVKQKPKPPILPTPRYQNQIPNSGPKPMALATPNVNWRTKPVNGSSSTPFRKQLTQKELEEKRAKNQCFYCDQKYTPGHKCSEQVYSLEVLGDTSTELLEAELEEEVLHIEEIIEYSPHISLNAINGTNTYQTMRVYGHVRKHKLHILIDCGSTHNFLDLNIAKKLGCQLKSTCPLQVEVAGGHQLTSKYMCKSFGWKLYGEEFRTDVMVIPLGGCEMVLDIQWLSTLGDILSNFKELRMEFKHNGKKVVLRGTQKTDLQWMQGSKMLIQTPRIELSSMILCVYPTTTLHMITTEESKEVPEVISKLLDNYTDVFAIPTTLPPIRSCDHQIPLKEGTIPINSRPYRHPPTQKDAIEVMVKELLDTGVIRDSQSPFSSPVVMGKFPIPVIEELIDELQGSQYFTKLDLRYLRKFVLVFFDDILVYSPTLEYHVKHLEVVLQALRQNILYAKQSKCVFGTKQVEYLGHVITKEGVATDGSKIEAMKNWPKPTNLKQLRGFLGLTGYYKRFVKYYAVISYPLTQLLKNNGFGWNPTAQEAFDKLKQTMVEAPVLKLPNFNELFVIETDASQTGIGAVLQQGGHPVSYYSKSLATRHQTLSTYEKELLSVIQALNKWRGYLLDRHFKIKTDHFSLKYLLEQRITTPSQMKWLPKLMGFDYDILYKKGSENKADDALSRIPTSA